MTRKIIFGVPKGSLNKPGRGDTKSLLEDAGYIITGYSPGEERIDILGIENDQDISLRLLRPQNAPGDLKRKRVDIAIIGDDWVEEESSAAGPLMKLADLEYGKVNIVVAAPQNCGADTLSDLLLSWDLKREPICFYSEYPKLTSSFLLQNPAYQQLFGRNIPVIEMRGIKSGENEDVQIIYSEGGTEQYLEDGFPIVDNTQTGTSLERAGGKILKDGKIMSSSAGLYARLGLDDDKYLWEKANGVKEMLVGAVVGRKYDYIAFNIEPIKRDTIAAYIEKERLALKGPTISPIQDSMGRTTGFAVGIVVPKDRYPEVTSALKGVYGVEGIVRSKVTQLIL